MPSADGLCAIDIDFQTTHPDKSGTATDVEISAAARAVLDRCVLRKDVARKELSLGGVIFGIGESSQDCFCHLVNRRISSPPPFPHQISDLGFNLIRHDEKPV